MFCLDLGTCLVDTPGTGTPSTEQLFESCKVRDASIREFCLYRESCVVWGRVHEAHYLPPCVCRGRQPGFCQLCLPFYQELSRRCLHWDSTCLIALSVSVGGDGIVCLLLFCLAGRRGAPRRQPLAYRWTRLENPFRAMQPHVVWSALATLDPPYFA